jgi:predicted transcriptional regulator
VSAGRAPIEEESASGYFGSIEEGRGYAARRSQLEIQMDILRAVNEGAFLPTQIMYHANLAWGNLKSSLGSMLANRLLERITVGERGTYRLTLKGTFILASFNRIIEVLHDPT